jgi:hypothetical protein
LKREKICFGGFNLWSADFVLSVLVVRQYIMTEEQNGAELLTSWQPRSREREREREREKEREREREEPGVRCIIQR